MQAFVSSRSPVRRDDYTWSIKIMPIAAALIDLSACVDQRPVEASEVTWDEHISPIVAASCAGCHRPGGIAPFSLNTYEEARPFADAMAEAVEQDIMPPFLARETEDCKPRLPWAHDPRLTSEQKRSFRAWADAKAPRGHGSPRTAPSKLTTQTLQREDVVMPIPGSIEVAGHQELHTCVIVDPGLAEDSYVTGRTVTPGNNAILHHVVSYILLPGQNEDGKLQTKQDLENAIKADKNVGIGGRYPCFGGPGLRSVQFELLDAWGPGGVPNLTPAGSGIPIPKDSLVLLDMHYHSTTVDDQVDTGTALSLMLATEKPSYISKNAFVGNFGRPTPAPSGIGDIVKQPDEAEAEFLIPPNVKDHVEEFTWLWQLPEDLVMQVYVTSAHMHYVGRSLQILVERNPDRPSSEPQKECLLETPQWDFDWQRGYVYDAMQEQLPTLRNGDKLRVRCTYDNTLDNPALQLALLSQGLPAPIPVRLGEDALDEMCLGAVGVMFPAR